MRVYSLFYILGATSAVNKTDRKTKLIWQLLGIFGTVNDITVYIKTIWLTFSFPVKFLLFLHWSDSEHWTHKCLQLKQQQLFMLQNNNCDHLFKYLPVMFVMFLSCSQTISWAFYIWIANTGVTTNCYSVIRGQIMAPEMIQMTVKGCTFVIVVYHVMYLCWVKQSNDLQYKTKLMTHLTMMTYLTRLDHRWVSAQPSLSLSIPRPLQWPARARPQSCQSDPDTLLATCPAQPV